MKYTHTQHDNIAVFELDGSLLGENEGQSVKNDVGTYLDAGVTRFLIDLTHLKHINSSGLGTFITLYTRVKGKGGDMVLCSPTSNIANLLAVTKLNTVFSVAADRATALSTLAATA